MSGSRFQGASVFAVALAALSLLAALPAQGQSLLARGGLGLLAEPLEARARGLGGVGLGLPEAGLSLVNPAEIVGLPAPALHVTFQPDYYTTDLPGGSFSGSTARFPLIHVGLPLGERWALSLGYGSLLDQNWAVEQQDSITIGDDRVEVRDRFASRGGVSRLRLGGAYRFGEQLALGVGLDVHTGSVRDTVVRFFGDGDLLPAGAETSRDYSGLSYVAGARWAPSEALALSGALSVGGTLEAEPGLGDTVSVTQRHDLPLTATFGASARVVASTLVAVSTRWAGWSSADGSLDDGAARDSWSVAGGIEWDALSIANQVLPLRFGGRYGTLPFEWRAGAEGGGFIDERVLTAGAGLRLGQGAARADLAVERGSRGGEEVRFDESFWRLALSLTVLGR